MPVELLEEGACDKVTIPNLCGYGLIDFWREFDTRFCLSTHLQRRTHLAHNGDTTFLEAKQKAHSTSKSIVF